MVKTFLLRLLAILVPTLCAGCAMIEF